MSHPELRALGEALRILGYPRPVSVESFRHPNFALVADILSWLVLRLDPSAAVPSDLETESARISFLMAAISSVHSRTSLLLHAQALYRADEFAARELLLVARELVDAAEAAETATQKGEQLVNQTIHFSIRPSELAAVRLAASEVNEQAGRLGDLMAQERGRRDARSAATKLLDAISAGPGAAGGAYEKVERAVWEALHSAQDDAARNEQQLVDLREDEEALQGKLQRRQAELARASKRLELLAAVRPAFMDEYERLESELAEEQIAYVTKVRNLDYLKAEVAAQKKLERRQVEEQAKAMRQLQKQLREEEFRALRGDEDVDEEDLQLAAVQLPGPPAPQPDDEFSDEGQETNGDAELDFDDTDF